MSALVPQPRGRGRAGQASSSSPTAPVARAIARGEAALAQRLAQGGYTTARNTVSEVAVARLHPGVIRYHREVGLLP